MSPKKVKRLVRFLVVVFITAMLVCLVGMCFAEAAEYKPATQKTQAHEIAEAARALGLPETDPIIVRAKELWNEAEAQIDADAVMLSQLMYLEGRGIESDVEKACIAWTALNRVDTSNCSIAAIVTAPAQFAYTPTTPVLDNLLALSYDVLNRWQREKAGETNVGRVLPPDYFWYWGDGKHNYFCNVYGSKFYWNYSLPSPY